MDHEAMGADVEVCSLVDRFGGARAMGDPAGCVEEVVADALAERPGEGRALDR